MSTNLKAGQLDRNVATLGKRRPSSRSINTRQYRYAFNALSTNVLAFNNYVVIEQPGKAFGLNPASDASAVAIVHINEPGNPIYITPATPKPIPEGFERLLLERPTQPAVPARADLFYIFDLSDKSDGIVYGPLSPASANNGADNYNAPGRVLVNVLPNAVTVPKTIVAARAGRRLVSVRNVSALMEKVYVTLDGTNTNQDVGSAGCVAELDPGEIWTGAYTGGVFAFASAATAQALPYELM